MTATTLNLADFLLQRLAEDEAAARAATPGPWSVDEAYGVVRGRPLVTNQDPAMQRPVCPASGYDDWGPLPMDAAHIARHDPARVLAECESKRAIVEVFRPGRIVLHDSTGFRAQTGEMDDPRGMDVLRALASVYADHPDFDPAWSMAAEFAVGPGPAWDA